MQPERGEAHSIAASTQQEERPEVNESGAWRLQDELDRAGAPEWLRMSGEVQLRYERLRGQFRPAARLDENDQVLVMRTLFTLGADFERFALKVEFQDSRAFGADDGSPINTAAVNTLELLQANATVRFGDTHSGTHELVLGRYTLDLGSRRVVARNIFRNTINAFTGLLWTWKTEDSTLTALYGLPVARRPNDLDSLIDNDIQIDREDSDRQLFGLHFASSAFERHQWDVYGLGLLEEQPGSRDRKLLSLGGRVLLPKQRNRLDYELEAILQVGESRLSATGQSLDHLAGFVHAAVGYTFDASWQPRIRAAFDYGSGDSDPSDGENNRFDTLFGVPREYAPTGFYRAFTRENLISAEIRLELEPQEDLSLFLSYRIGWLAARKDAWVAAGIQDSNGDSGRLIGHQIEARLRWDLVPQTVQVEVGGAYLFHGEFQDRAPGGQDTDSFFIYTQLVINF